MEDFRIDFSDPEQKRRFIEYCKTFDSVQVIHINTALTQRTMPLNRYYWGVVLGAVSEYSGFTPDELHIIFKKGMLPGVVFRKAYNISTASLNQREMWAYCLRIRHWFLMFTGRVIPDPYYVIRPDMDPDDSEEEVMDEVFGYQDILKVMQEVRAEPPAINSAIF